MSLNQFLLQLREEDWVEKMTNIKFRICKKSTKPLNPRPLSLGKTSFDFYNVRVEKNGQEINIDRQINEITSTSNKNIFVDINFKLTENIDIDPPGPKVYETKVLSNIGRDGDFTYQT